MNNQDLYSQYSWVLKVLESCENFEQVETSVHNLITGKDQP